LVLRLFGLVLASCGGSPESRLDIPAPYAVHSTLVVDAQPKKLPASFYRSASGAEPVRDWLRALTGNDRKILGYDIGLVEFGWPVGMPLCRPLGGGLLEIRSSLEGNRVARVIFCITDGSMILLHGFIKKTRKAPKTDLDLARDRQKEVAR
jgi:phage-related protein